MGAFIPTILSEFGWVNIKAQLYSVPPYVVACFLTIGLGYCSDRLNRRGIFMLVALCFSITGFSLLRFSDDIHAKYAAVFLNAIGVFAASSGFLSWGVNNTASPAVAAVAGGYMVSNYMRSHNKRQKRIEGLTPDQERLLGHRHPAFKYME
ncbi:MAG: hypothetical protein STHCBS139747_003403 [Sporothrix thermara]